MKTLISMSKTSKLISFSLVLFVLIISMPTLNSCTKDRVQPLTLTACDSLNVTYSQVVKPIILLNCATSGCHLAGTNVPGDYSSYDGLKLHVDNGKFKLRTITYRDMPPNGPLSESDIQKLNCWLDAGAPNN